MNKVRNMHYEFKRQLNKLDSQKYRNLLVPEIDWVLNQALHVFIKMTAFPKYASEIGFETTQRSIDSIRTLVIEDHEINAALVKDNVYGATLPENYMHHLKSKSHAVKGNCTATIRNTISQRDDKFEESVFNKSSFEWRELNVLFTGDKLHVFTDGTFSIDKVYLDYVKKPVFFHTAVDARGGTYNLPDGTNLSGFLNCELPEQVYDEIVDIAVLITTGDLLGDYQTRQAKIQMTN